MLTPPRSSEGVALSAIEDRKQGGAIVHRAFQPTLHGFNFRNCAPDSRADAANRKLFYRDERFGSQRSASRPAQRSARRRAATSGGRGSSNPTQNTIAGGTCATLSKAPARRRRHTRIPARTSSTLRPT